MLKLKFQYFGPLMQRTNSLEKTLMLGKIEGRRRRGRQEEMVGWHHWLDGYEFGQALGGRDAQRSLSCCSPWGHKESDTPERLNWTEPAVALFPGKAIKLFFSTSPQTLWDSIQYQYTIDGFWLHHLIAMDHSFIHSSYLHIPIFVCADRVPTKAVQPWANYFSFLGPLSLSEKWRNLTFLIIGPQIKHSRKHQCTCWQAVDSWECDECGELEVASLP